MLAQCPALVSLGELLAQYIVLLLQLLWCIMCDYLFIIVISILLQGN